MQRAPRRRFAPALRILLWVLGVIAALAFLFGGYLVFTALTNFSPVG
ncbi:MAG: hypothetical protein FWG25_02180 [Promicromonosporaceae bacterium]|nr:hypothetical protein [Promicromonosporaceae bacterium]